MAYRYRVGTDVTVAYDAQIPRICAHCGHSYHITRHVEASAGATKQGMWDVEFGESKANEKAHRRCERQVSAYVANKATHGPLCPHCMRFSPEAIDRYFPNGFRAGLLEMIRVKRPRLIVWILMYPGIILLAAIPIVVLERVADLPGLGKVLWMAGAAIMSVVVMQVCWQKASVATEKCTVFLEGLTEDDAREFALWSCGAA